MKRNSRSDVIAAAGRLFARDGYHGTSMRELGRELGMLGSSLYAHVDSKQDLLVEVVQRGAAFFGESAAAALRTEGTAADRMCALIAGHVDVVLDHGDEVRTFLYEASSLDDRHRQRVVAERDRYEHAFRTVIAQGVDEGSLRTTDPKIAAIFVLSILNALERWYREDGAIGRDELVERVYAFVMEGIGPVRR